MSCRVCLSCVPVQVVVKGLGYFLLVFHSGGKGLAASEERFDLCCDLLRPLEVNPVLHVDSTRQNEPERGLDAPVVHEVVAEGALCCQQLCALLRSDLCALRVRSLRVGDLAFHSPDPVSALDAVEPVGCPCIVLVAPARAAVEEVVLASLRLAAALLVEGLGAAVADD